MKFINYIYLLMNYIYLYIYLGTIFMLLPAKIVVYNMSVKVLHQ